MQVSKPNWTPSRIRLPECPPVHKALSVMHKSNVVCPPVTDKVKKGKSLLGFNDMQKKKKQGRRCVFDYQRGGSYYNYYFMRLRLHYNVFVTLLLLKSNPCLRLTAYLQKGVHFDALFFSIVDKII
jgi:hypothetical protein